jgi:formate hydrogenlyase transcriptional activator
MASLEESPAAEAMRTRQPLMLNRLDAEGYPSPIVRRLLDEGLRSAICIPLLRGGRALGALNVASTREAAFAAEDVELLTQIGNELAIAVENALAFRQIEELKDKLAQEKLYLEDEIRTEYDFEEIVGDSHSLKRVLHDVETVAPTDSTVLVQGESGTGKELIARAIHNLSGRRQRTFVKVNCAAIPTGLIESELFGHEKGAFTGAIGQKIGRFELADKGTLFLDEIGDIPLELQPKLLRVLQEREFQRVGSSETVRVDVRLIAATNVDLVERIREKRFREDLYYRLNVVPISTPPLRERLEDIPKLVHHFIHKICRQEDILPRRVTPETLARLGAHDWPGNVRQLENEIERVIAMSGDREVLYPSDFALPAGQPSRSMRPARAAVALPESGLDFEQTVGGIEREILREALRKAGGNKTAAASMLGLKRTTLAAKLKSLEAGVG